MTRGRSLTYLCCSYDSCTQLLRHKLFTYLIYTDWYAAGVTMVGMPLKRSTVLVWLNAIITSQIKTVNENQSSSRYGSFCKCNLNVFPCPMALAHKSCIKPRQTPLPNSWREQEISWNSTIGIENSFLKLGIKGGWGERVRKGFGWYSNSLWKWCDIKKESIREERERGGVLNTKESWGTGVNTQANWDIRGAGRHLLKPPSASSSPAL